MTNPNEANINVVLTPVAASPEWPHGIQFALQSPLLEDGKLVFHNRGKPGFKLSFNIVDAEATGFLFPRDKAKAMWVKKVADVGEDCPAAPMYWDKFEANKVDPGNRVLRVFNRNDAEELFKFTLLFTRTPEENGPCIDFDPIGDNRNGLEV